MAKKGEKKFGSNENGCIFAPALTEKRGLLKSEVEGSGRERFETDETRDSVCRSSSREAVGERHERVKGNKKAILTMKSLILAQDER